MNTFRQRIASACLVLLLLVLGGCSAGNGGGGGAGADVLPPNDPAPNETPGSTPGPSSTTQAPGQEFSFVLSFANTPDGTVSQEQMSRIGSFLQPVVDGLNSISNLPDADMPVLVGYCGMVNAFFDPTNRRIVMCIELLDYFRQIFDRYDTDDATRTLWSEQSFVFTLLHETGHAFVSELELPVFGNTESAADSIASVLAVGMNKAASVITFASATRDLPASFEDEHAGGQDRSGDLVCWALGGDLDLPGYDADRQRYIDAGRDCTAEFAEQRASVRNWLPAAKTSQYVDFGSAGL